MLKDIDEVEFDERDKAVKLAKLKSMDLHRELNSLKYGELSLHLKSHPSTPHPF